MIKNQLTRERIEERKYLLELNKNYTLDMKIQKSIKIIQEFYEKNNGNVIISFSGGRDSSVLLHLIRSIYPNIKAVFADTGLEFPENREIVFNTENCDIVKPKKSFKIILEEYGIPIVSKESSQNINEIRNSKSEKLIDKRLNGKNSAFGNKCGMLSKKWHFLINAPFKISNKCCYYMKKSPLQSYSNKTKSGVYIGTQIEESRLRLTSWYKTGCNDFNNNHSSPLSLWNKANIKEYIKRNNIEISKIYEKGYEQTGCMFCLYGVHFEEYPNRLVKLQELYPDIYIYIMEKLKFKEILDWYNENRGKNVKPIIYSKEMFEDNNLKLF